MCSNSTKTHREREMFLFRFECGHDWTHWTLPVGLCTDKSTFGLVLIRGSASCKVLGGSLVFRNICIHIRTRLFWLDRGCEYFLIYHMCKHITWESFLFPTFVLLYMWGHPLTSYPPNLKTDANQCLLTPNWNVFLCSVLFLHMWGIVIRWQRWNKPSLFCDRVLWLTSLQKLILFAHLITSPYARCVKQLSHNL